MRILSPRVHGVLDYAIVALLLLAPALFGFAGVAATICYALAIVQLGMSLLTNYPLSIAKLVPFPVHGAIELATSIGLLAMPWIFGFHTVDAARNFFVVGAIGLGLVWLVTNYQGVPATSRGSDDFRAPLRR